MLRRFNLVSYCLVVLMLGFTASGASSQIASTANLDPPHRTALARWLSQKPMLRLALEKDCRNVEGLAASRVEYGRNYQPYYVSGDFNHDGQQDFAVALINERQRSRRFAIAIFNGPFSQRGTSSPAFFSEGMDLRDGGLVTLPGNRLVAGVFQSDDCVVLRPRGRTYAMKSCL